MEGAAFPLTFLRRTSTTRSNAITFCGGGLLTQKKGLPTSTGYQAMLGVRWEKLSPTWLLGDCAENDYGDRVIPGDR